MISIVVPVYNAEPYLARCVDSILRQTFSEFELILVDDGSTDSSGLICDEYSQKDGRVRVIHKSNGGVSMARQAGLDASNGKYVIHVDPDDWIEETMLSELYLVAQKQDSDIVICDYFEEFKDYSRRIVQDPGEDLSPGHVLELMMSQKLHGACWNKLVRRSLFSANGISFPSDIIRWEDLYVTCELLCNDNLTISYCGRALYHYDRYSNPGSILRHPTIDGVNSQIFFIDHFEKKPGGVKLYQEAFFILKAVTKELAFESNLFSGQYVIDLYNEINLPYIKKHRLDFRHPTSLSLSLLLSGRREHFCRRVFYVIDSLRKVFHKIKSLT